MTVSIHNSTELIDYEFDGVPSKGDLISINDITYIVISVKWIKKDNKYIPTIVVR